MTDSPAFVAATYNIHRGVGRGGRPDYGRIVDVIALLDADIIALQEVETPLKASPMSLLRVLHEMGYAPVLGSTLIRTDCRYGNVLLSRLPALRHDLVDLSMPRREPRGLIDLHVKVAGDAGPSMRSGSVEGTGRARAPGVLLRCLATHLGLGGRERRRQIARMLRWLDGRWLDRHGHQGETIGHRGGVRPDSVSMHSPPDIAHSSHDAHRPVLLMGDFNEWRPNAPRLLELHRRFRAVPTAPTYPARRPLLALDRIYYRGGLRLDSWEVVRTPLTRAASDHLPLLARFAPAPLDAQPGLPAVCSPTAAVQ